MAINNDLYGSSFLRQIVRVIAAVSMDAKQCKAMIAEDRPVIVDAVGKIPEGHAMHGAHFALQTVHFPGGEQERRAALEDTRDTRNCPGLIFVVEMEHDAPCDRSIKNAIGEWT